LMLLCFVISSVIISCNNDTITITNNSVTLFSDGFTDLNKWIIPGNNGTLDTTFGNPRPSLNIGPSSSPMFMRDAFSGAQGFTLSFDAALLTRGSDNNR